MSVQYDEYLQQHVNAVYKGFCWMKENIPDIFGGDDVVSKIDYNIKFGHDRSKQEPDEYQPYDAYFYGKNRSAQVVEDFNYAWLEHIHRNPHHWQHWILHKDDPNEITECLRMPDVFVIEMICDWWSFSWNKGNLWEIFKWYEERKEHIMLNPESKEKVESVLKRMKEKLTEIQEAGPQNGAEGAMKAPVPDNSVDINKLMESGLADALNQAINGKAAGGIIGGAAQ